MYLFIYHYDFSKIKMRVKLFDLIFKLGNSNIKKRQQM